MEAPQCNNKKYENFIVEKKFCMGAIHGESSTVTEEAIITGDTVFVEDDMATSVANVLNRRKNVQSTIFDAGKELHHRYKASSKLNFAQMKWFCSVGLRSTVTVERC
ncbi:hypothetical protein MFLAVUS_000418 [Mucor flavus]|uniref:Uncharacterized protein n=1 Tax=Mucor flavus TaxID=439312 RepID=A0ABP9YJN3_9FUNG